MNAAYLVGHITVKDAEKWRRYRAQVPATLQPWGAEVTFRGKLFTVFSGEHPYDDIVVICFPDKESVTSWYASPAYQALLPLRQQAADMLLLAYEAPPS
jgi:uncharacterized protein (DUF1330 family)